MSPKKRIPRKLIPQEDSETHEAVGAVKVDGSAAAAASMSPEKSSVVKENSGSTRR